MDPTIENQTDPLAPTPPTDDPLSTLGVVEDQRTLQDDDTLNRRSSIYGFANYLDKPDPNMEDLADQYGKQTQLAKDILRTYGEKELRNEQTTKALTNTINNLNLIGTEMPEGLQSSYEAASAQLSIKAAEKANYDAERAWAEGIALLRDGGQNEVADFREMAHSAPDLFAEQIKIQSTRAMIMKEIEDVGVAMEDRGWMFNLVDFAMYFVPFSETWARTDNFETAATNWYDNIFSGNRTQAEGNSMWQAALRAKTDTERQAIIQTFVNNANTNTRWMGGQNLLIKQSLLQNLTGYIDPVNINAQDLINNGPLIGAMGYKAFKVPFKVTNHLKGFGATNQAVENVTKAAEDIRTLGPQAAAAKRGLTLDEVEDNLIVKALDPNTPVTRADGAFTRAQINKEMDAVEKLDIPLAEKEELLGDLRRQLAATRDAPFKPTKIEPAAPAGPAKADPSIINLSGMGSAISENFYKGWFDTLDDGPLKSSTFKKEPRFKEVEDLFENGKIKNWEDLKAYLNKDAPKQAPAASTKAAGAVPAKTTTPPSAKTAATVAPLVDDVDAVRALANDKISEGLDSIEELIGDLIFTQRLDDAAQLRLKNDMIKRIGGFGAAKSRSTRIVHEPNLIPRDLPTGQTIYEFEATVGNIQKTGKNPWYATEKTALEAAGRLGVSDAVPIQMVDGGWGVRFKLPVDEAGESLAGARIYAPFADKQTATAGSFFTRWVGGGKVQASTEIHGLAQLSVDKQNKILAKVKENVLPAFHAISDKERMVLKAVMSVGERQGKWFTDQELQIFYKENFGLRADDKKFVKAYRMAEEVNDMEYAMRNIQELVDLSTRGYQKLTFNGVAGKNGKILHNSTKVPDEAIYMLSDDANQLGDLFVDSIESGSKTKRGIKPRLTTNQLKDFQQKGYVLVRTQKPQTMFLGQKRADIRYFLVKGDQVTSGPLDLAQIPYRAGGHRMYATPYFVKRGRTIEQPWGVTSLRTPHTPTASKTLAEAQQWAKDADKAREAYKAAVAAGKTEDEIADIVQGVLDESEMGMPPLRDATDPENPNGFLDWMERDGADNPFEAVFDRENPSMYNKGGINYDANEDLSGVNTFLETQGQMYRSPKGDVLRNISDWNLEAETIDPFKMLNTSLANVARLTSFTDFKIKSVNKWISTYGGALNTKGMEHMNPMRIFLDAKFTGNGREAELIAQQAEIQRQYIKRILGWRSDGDLALEATSRKAVEFMAGSNVNTRSKLVHATHEWWKETRPINALMGMSMDMTMGLFNLAQFPLQAQTSFAALTIDSVNGAKAMGNMPAIMLYMRKAGGEADLKQMVKWGWHKGMGQTPEDYAMMLRNLKKSGYMDNMASVLKNEYGPNAAVGMIGRGVRRVRESGRVFLDKAEEWNRAVAWQIAWLRTGKLYPELKAGSALHSEKVRTLAGTFAANMDEAGASWWQKNTATKLPTQFMGYMVRWHEMLWNPDFAKVFSKNSINLKSEKIRFVLGQSVLYGTAGIPFAAWIADSMEANAGEAADIDTVQGKMSRGLMDTIIHAVSGADVSFSERAGIGAYPTDVLMELLGMSRYGETSAADMMLGPTFQIFRDTSGAFGKLIYYTANESGGENGKPLTEHAVKTAARYISSLNNLAKAEAVWRYQQYTNRQDVALMHDLPSAYGFAALLGLAPGELQDLTAQMAWTANRTEREEDYAKQIIAYRQQVANAIKDGNYLEADRVSEGVNFLVKVLIPHELREGTLDRANKSDVNEGIVESVAKKIEEEKKSDAFIKGSNN